MTAFSGYRCDQCGKKESGSKLNRPLGWHWVSSGPGYDFCSDACLAAWATNRAKIVPAQRETFDAVIGKAQARLTSENVFGVPPDPTERKPAMSDEQEETTTETLRRVSLESSARRREAEMQAFLDQVAIVDGALCEMGLAHARLAKTRDDLAKAGREWYPADHVIRWALEAIRRHNKECADALKKAGALLPKGDS
jgi:hypothetical protein